MKRLILLLLSSVFISAASGQENFEDPLGAWYMVFWNTDFGESKWGAQGDVQFRNWNFGGDLEQLLLRGGITYKPADKIKLTLGYGNITTGQFGVSKETVTESRIYQEALLSQRLGDRFHFTHRFRYEQRWTTAENIRTRYRYNLFLNLPLNQKDMSQGALYLAFYNELFVNGQKNIGGGASVEFYDRNRFYSALGFMAKQNLKIQLGMMQQTTNSWSKNQVQLSAHIKF